VQKRIPSVPLFLIPKVIQEQIKKKGTSVFSIFVERRLHHQYRVRVETFFEHSRRVLEGKAEQEACVSLPGTFDLSKMMQVTKDPGKCPVCGVAKVEWIEEESGVMLCGRCYGRERRKGETEGD